MSWLRVDIADFKAKVHDLFAAYPELEDDEQLRADMVEAETDINRLVARLVKMKLDARELAAGARARKAEIADRLSRFERQEDGYTDLLKSVMLAADLPKVTLPEATVSITKPRTKVNITDLDALPQGFFAIERKAKSAEIKAALEAGDQIPGAELALGDDGLMVRTK